MYKAHLGSISLTLILLLFTIGSLSAQPQFVAGTDQAKLLAKAKSHGSVPVIVGLDVPFTPERKPSSAQAVKDRRRGIAKARSRVLSRLAGHDVSQVKEFEDVPYLALQIDTPGLQALLADPAVAAIQEDVPVPPTLSESVPFIHADALRASGYDGSGYAVAVLDTGVRKTHEVFGDGQVVSEACYSSTYNAYNASTVCPDGSQAQTGNGAGINCEASLFGCSHGTHVAGIVSGNGVRHGTGVAPGADIIAVQVFSRFDNSTANDNICGSENPCVLSFTSDQMEGLQRIIELSKTKKIAAVNMSLGGGKYADFCDDDMRKPFVDTLRSLGIATVIASGNNGYDGFVGAPACISSAVTVGATLDDADSVAFYSNHAELVDLMAPGSTILSAVADTDSSYSTYNGTSMAAPHVAGAFAVMKDYDGSLTISQIEQLLESTGSTVSRLGVAKPRLDLLAATQVHEPSAFPWAMVIRAITAGQSRLQER